jgi:response regulator RpfG family c-di-GMP phosphodiesterase
MQPKILFVDDDPHILAGYQRQLRKHFAIDTAPGPEAGLEVLANGGDFAVVVSDLRMPGMDGIQFLSQVRERHRDTVRIMLTGFADMTAAIAAVNRGHIFRFLTKPCDTETMVLALQAGLEQHRLVRAERDLLEQTLSGAVKVLTQILSLLNPEAFGRAARLTRTVQEIAYVMKVQDAWPLETAARLSQIGCILLPQEALHKVYQGAALTPEEIRLYLMHPGLARDLLQSIPRLEGVAEIIAYQEKRFDGGGIPQDRRRGEDIPLGSRILKVALDFDNLERAGHAKSQALALLKQRLGRYDPAVLSALEAALWIESKYEVKTVLLRELSDAMILDEDVMTLTHTLLITKGQEVNPLVRKRLQTFAETVGVKEPLMVLVPRHLPQD